MTFQTATIAELDRIPVASGLEWRPIRRRFDIRSFGVNAYTAANVGDWVVEEHTESSLGHEELYLVVSGRARFRLDGEEVDAPAGTVVAVSDPRVSPVATAEEEGTTVLAVGGKPGEAYEPSAWEWYFIAYGLADQGKLDEAVATMEEAVATSPDDALLLYHYACLESRAGRAEAARSHLARAIELQPDLEQRARGDSDLEDVL